MPCINGVLQSSSKNRENTKYVQSIDRRWGHTTLWIDPGQGANAYNGVQWRVKSRTWDWWGSPSARYGFSSRKSHVFESLRSLRAWHMSSNGCLFQNTRSSVDRSSTLDTSLSRRRGYIRVLRLGLRHGDDVASLITNSRIGGHTHTEEENILSLASKFL